MLNTANDLLNINFRTIYFQGHKFGRKDIIEGIDHLASYLKSNIYSGSPFILLTSYNHIKTIIAYYAILKAGKIPAIMDPGCKSIELTETIEDIDPCAILFLNTSSLRFNYEEEIVFRTQNPGLIITSDLKDVVTLAYTNAEDGFSKGAMLTEKNLLSEIKSLIQTNKLDSSSVTCALLPFSHLFGLVQGILVPTHAGCTNLVMEMNIMRITDLIEKIRDYKVTHLYTIPSLYYLMGKVPGIREMVNGIREFYSGGTQLTPFIFNSFYQKTDRKIREGYGLTESSPGVALNYGEEDPVMSSMGKPLPGCDIRIMNDEGIECFPHNIGEICIRGDMVFKGYFNNEEATNGVLKEGWLRTGDYGRKDLNGNIYFCGLKKNMINVAGNNVYPRKLERMMGTNKNAEKVTVTGEESVLQGQIVIANVRLKDSSPAKQEEYKRWCYENINNIILPKIWNFE